MRGFPSSDGVKAEYFITLQKVIILLLLARLKCKQLQINTDMLLIITGTNDELFSGINIVDLERPRNLKIKSFS